MKDSTDVTRKAPKMASAAVAKGGSSPLYEKDLRGLRHAADKSPRSRLLLQQNQQTEDEFVVVCTVEEVELSLSSVVAMPDLSETDSECSMRQSSCDEKLEARVRATQQVANVHELALLESASGARALARKLGGETTSCDDDVDDAARKCELESFLQGLSRGGAGPVVEEPVELGPTTGEGLALLVRDRPIRTRYSCRDLVGDSASAKDESEHQARRDIERDSLVVQGTTQTKLEGRVGYDTVVDKLVRCGQKLVERADAAEWRQDLKDEDYRNLAKLSLRAVNRTESGGLALVALQRLIKSCDVVPVPDSKKAEPLKVTLALGPFYQNSSWRWGLVAQVEGSTFYRLFAQDDFDNELPVHCRATYSNNVLLPLDALGGDPNIVYDRDTATVDLHLTHHRLRVDSLADELDGYAVVDK